MECTARVIRERKEIGRFPGDKPKTTILIYCPVLGELVLSGEQAEKAIEKIKGK